MRLFVAVNFSDEMKHCLIKAVEELRKQCSYGNYTREENLHLTLAFIGETTRVSDVIRVIDGLDVRGFDMTLSGFGNFGKLYWAGIEDNPRLNLLAMELQDGLRDVGFDIEKRSFKPHITLAREIESKKRPDITVPKISAEVGRISLMRSDRIGGKLCYREVYGRDI